MSAFTYDLPYPSQREPITASNVVATSVPVAANAGLEMLRRGGTAADAAIATAACMTVVEPTTNGLGGDAFALVWDGKKVHGWNGSGRSPQRLDPAAVAGDAALESVIQQAHGPKGWVLGARDDVRAQRLQCLQRLGTT